MEFPHVNVNASLGVYNKLTEKTLMHVLCIMNAFAFTGNLSDSRFEMDFEFASLLLSWQKKQTARSGFI